MNVGHANQKHPDTIEFLSIMGGRKTLSSDSEDSATRAVKAEAIANLADFECLVCLDVQEKILQTRCCDAVLCAVCYLHIQPPKRCPNDSSSFCGRIERDLKPASRLVSGQIERLSRHFADITAGSSPSDAYKCQVQRTTLCQMGHTPPAGKKPPVEAQLDGAVAPNAVQGAAHIDLGRVAQMRIGDGGVVIKDRIIKGKNIVIQNGRLMSGQDVEVITPTVVDARRSYYFLANAIGILDVCVCQGNLVLAAGSADEQNVIHIVAESAPELNNRVLHINSIDSVLIKLPAAFSETLQLHTMLGSITTMGDYRIKSGGSIHADLGNVNIKVDTLLVQPSGTSYMSHSQMNLSREQVTWQRAHLRIRANMGNISVTD